MLVFLRTETLLAPVDYIFDPLHLRSHYPRQRHHLRRPHRTRLRSDGAGLVGYLRRRPRRQLRARRDDDDRHVRNGVAILVFRCRIHFSP